MARRPRLAQIDILKGLAVVGVIAQHAIPNDGLEAIGADFHFRQAVPLFLVLMGMNAATSFWRQGPAPLRALYTRAYAISRVERIFVPFVVAFLASIVVGAIHGGLEVYPLLLVGGMPFTGPGAYFVTVLFTFAVVAPLIYWAYRRAPAATIVALVVLDVAFELVAPEFISYESDKLYEVSLLRYGAALAIGFWLADPRSRRLRVPVVAVLAALSAAYVIALERSLETFDLLMPGFGLVSNAAAVGLATAFVLLGMRLLPRTERDPLSRLLAEMGRASYHIFLVQILWFGALEQRSLTRFAIGLVACSAIGWLFFRLVPGRLPARLRQP